ncbi:MAG: bifunctional methylenetetrahydrofolate dehydrogenase/methenyltetrahydrofolate cyclohydrolase FolD [Planctomycetota bacterium]
MTTILDGKLTAKEVRARVKEGCAAFTEKTGRAPGLAVVLVGDDPASAIYTRNKGKAAKKCGMYDVHHHLPADTPEADVLALVRELNEDARVDGILVQLPLPGHVDTDKVIAAISPEKDADGFNPVNVGRLWLGQPAPVACTPLGITTILDRYEIDVKGMNAVIIGRSNIVGKPMAALLMRRHATVTVCHSRTKDLPDVIRAADLIVAAIGRAKFVTGDMVKEGAVVLDVGINRLEDGTLCGDVDFEAAAERASAITPVPGGVGPMTIATLLANVLTLAEARGE